MSEHRWQLADLGGGVGQITNLTLGFSVCGRGPLFISGTEGSCWWITSSEGEVVIADSAAWTGRRPPPLNPWAESK